MKKLILFSILCICHNGYGDCSPARFGCEVAKTVQVSKIDKALLDANKLLLFREVVGDDIKCILVVENFKLKKSESIFSHICEFNKNSFSYVSTPLCPSDMGFSTPKSIRKSDLKYMWHIGECSLDSQKYFYVTLKEKSSVKKLEKNKFLLVSEDDKSLTYYANPGFVVKLEKNEELCKKNKKCELNVILKKHLSSAILDADGKLHTDESI